MPHSIPATMARLTALPADGADGPSGPSLVGALRDGGALAWAAGMAHEPSDPLALAEALAAIGAESLSAGRLFEGHVNALKLIRLYGDGADLDAARRGALFGIWGADGPNPVRICGDHLHGTKLFASGADMVDRIIVTARTEAGPQLLLLRREMLRDRLFPEEWQVSGMCATASGRCDLDGVPLDQATPLGVPGDYLQEPYFHGGVWRYAAVQMGAMRRLTQATIRQLRARGQTEAPLQALRLRYMLTACETARLWVQRAAIRCEAAAAMPEAADDAILARLVVADLAEEVLRHMDHALGAASFLRGHEVERIRRDLGFYLRQANPDGLSQTAIQRLVSDPARLDGWLS
ncbi:acyl-CoA dehydrogenase family protein [Falsirhodobacter halotolerans]|uniref:acyl-CoA dehydrogenase family protein n=1 Tax=Falsirhodobacter halotolerans TaxID=1146892 RepID=UPI001FD44FAC|nr:acyl-CoA dehydrogenase family protein [Falsirhodobacter halotolerans]MCJ8139953.1 hypothetical protein [Falsirhodobacter halotolerans]